MVEKGVKESMKIAEQLVVKNLVLFPFVHLSDEVSDPDTAKRIIEDFQQKLVSLGYPVDKAPFGWEKIFSLTSKGQPLAELSRTIRP